MISDDIVITVVDVRGDKVRLSVEAPPEIPVHRREVFDAIHRDAAAAEHHATSKVDSPAGNGGRS